MANPIENTAAATPRTNFGRILKIQELGGDGIEAMEAAGQQQLVGQTDRRVQLPTMCLPHSRDDTEAHPVETALIAAGVQLADVCDDDPLFRWYVLPEGWAIQPTDHAMWSNLVDDLGAPRFRIFYKAAFYDRRANIEIAAARY